MRRPGSWPSTADIPSGPPGRAGWHDGNSNTSATAPSPSLPRCTSPPGRSSPSRSAATTRPPSPAFLHLLDQGTDPRLNIHLIMDNGSSRTSRVTRAWITAHPRIAVTYTPKHASWLDMAELLLRPDPWPAAPGRIHFPYRPHRENHQFRGPLQPHRPPVHLDLRRRRRPRSPSRPPRQARRFRNPQAGPGQRPPSGRTAPTEAAAETCQGLMRCCIRAAASSRARGRRPPGWP